MQQTVLVRALRPFQHEGRTVARGEVIEVSPVQASILGRAHHVNLSEKNLQLAPSVSMPPAEAPKAPAPEVIESLQPIDAPPVKSRRGRGRYSRKDLRAEA